MDGPGSRAALPPSARTDSPQRRRHLVPRICFQFAGAGVTGCRCEESQASGQVGVLSG